MRGSAIACGAYLVVCWLADPGSLPIMTAIVGLTILAVAANDFWRPKNP